MKCKRRILAIATAFGCLLGSLPAIPAAAISDAALEQLQQGDSYQVVSVNFSEETNCVSFMYVQDLSSNEIFQISCGIRNYNAAIAGDEIPQAGDLIDMDWCGEMAEVYPGCMHLECGDTIENLGSVWELETIDLTVVSVENKRNFTLEAADGTQYSYCDSTAGYGGVEVLGAVGDTVTMAKFGDRVIRRYGSPDAAPVVEEWMMDFAVVGKNAETGRMALASLESGSTYYFSEAELEDAMTEQDPIEYGDMLRIRGLDMCTVLYGTNTFTLQEGYSVTDLGSLFDYGRVTTVTLGEKEEDYPTIPLTGEDGTYYYYIDYLANTPQQFCDPDWTAFGAGTQMDFVSFKGRPLLPLDSQGYVMRMLGMNEEKYYFTYLTNDEPNATNVFSIPATAADAYLCNSTDLRIGSIFRFYGLGAPTETYGVNGFEYADHAVIWHDTRISCSISSVLCTITKNDGIYVTAEHNGTSYRFCANWIAGCDSSTFQTDPCTLAVGDMLYLKIHNGRVLGAGERYYPEEHLDQRDYAVVGVDDAEDPQQYVLCSITKGSKGKTYYVDAQLLADFGITEPVGYGDFLTLYGTKTYGTATDGTFSLTMNPEEKGAYIQFTLRTPQSVYSRRLNYFADASLIDYTVTVDPEDPEAVQLTSDAGTFRYVTDFAGEYLQPNGVDWSSVQTGDTLQVFTYAETPLIPMDPALHLQRYYGEISNTYADYCILDGEVRVEMDALKAMLPEDYTAKYADGLIIWYTGSMDASTYPIGMAEMFYVFDCGTAGGTELRAQRTYYMDYLEAHQKEPIIQMTAGDVDADGMATILDVIQLSKCLMGTETLPDLTVTTPIRADFDQNGVVNTADALALMKKLVFMVY